MNLREDVAHPTTNDAQAGGAGRQAPTPDRDFVDGFAAILYHMH